MTQEKDINNPQSSASHSAVLSVAVAAPVDGVYDYLAGPALGAVRGVLVFVPFGGRILAGIVLGPAKGDVAVGKLRSIDHIVHLQALPEAMVNFIERVANWTMTPVGAVVKMVVSQPSALLRPPQKNISGTRPKYRPQRG